MDNTVGRGKSTGLFLLPASIPARNLPAPRLSVRDHGTGCSQYLLGASSGYFCAEFYTIGYPLLELSGAFRCGGGEGIMSVVTGVMSGEARWA